MKYSLIALRRPAFLAALLLCAVFCQAQQGSTSVVGTGTIKLDSTMSITLTTPYTGITFGWHGVNVFDTIPSVLLITECDTCQSKAVNGFFIRQKNVYSGDRMPPGNYDDYWSVVGNLNIDKKPFEKGVRIWQGVAK